MSDRGSDAFQRALDEAQRSGRAPDEGDPEATHGPHIRAGVPFGPAQSSGGEARFGLALDWTDEPKDLPPAPQAPRREADTVPADTPAEIAAELGLAAPLTLDQLTSRWRHFVWRNHPDRQPVEQREWANARVAIANTLYDRARRKLAKAR
jgi:hypothetical protein